MSWLNEKREEVEDWGPRSLALYEAARRSWSLPGAFREESIMSARVYVFVRSSCGGIGLVLPETNAMQTRETEGKYSRD